MPKYPFENRDGKKAAENQDLIQRAKESAEYIGDFGNEKLPENYSNSPWRPGEREQLMSMWDQVYKGNSAIASARSPIHDNWLYIIAAKDILTKPRNE